MFLKSVALLLVAVAVFAQAGVITSYNDLLEDNEYQVAADEDTYIPESLLIHLRPRRQTKKDEDRGSIGGDVSRSPDGTRVRADGDYNVHTSKDGRTRVDARGEYERTYHGPRGNSRPHYNVGVGFRHRFGRN